MPPTSASAHPKYKEALLGAIDTGTVIAGRYHRPTRVLRSDTTLKLKESFPSSGSDAPDLWESELGPERVRAPLLEGDLSSVAYCGAGVGLVSEILDVETVMRNVVEGAEAIIREIR